MIVCIKMGKFLQIRILLAFGGGKSEFIMYQFPSPKMNVLVVERLKLYHKGAENRSKHSTSSGGKAL